MPRQESGTVKPGDRAAVFTLKDQDDLPFELEKNRGKRSLLSFHPLAWTGVCSGQMKSLEQNFPRLVAVNTQAFGISVDSSPCKKAWAEHLGISKTRLLADFWPHGGVAQAFGVFDRTIGIAQRANIVVDEGMTVRFVKVYPIRELPDIEEIIRVLKEL